MCKVLILLDNLLYVILYHNTCLLVKMKQYDLAIDVGKALNKRIENISSARWIAIATNNIPEDALVVNKDGSINVYNEAGKKVGSVLQTIAEALTKDIVKVEIDK